MNPVILLETPLFSSTALIEIGKVAFDDEVEKAVSRGIAIFLKCFIGLAFPINLTISGKVMNIWTNNPIKTVIK